MRRNHARRLVAIVNRLPGRPAALQVLGLLYSWYRVHRAGGGACDAVMEQLIAQAELMECRGRRPRPADGSTT